MLYDPRDTIVAVASAPGGAARGIVRLSGPDVPRLVAQALIRSEMDAIAGAQRPVVRPASLRLSRPGVRCRASFISGRQRAATRGSQPPSCTRSARHRCWPRRSKSFAARGPGRPLRANSPCGVLAGRIDLTQAEAVLGVIDAQGERQLQAALAQLAGGLATPLGGFAGALLDLLARLEASLDFASEDIELIGRREIAAELKAAEAALDGSPGRSARAANRLTWFAWCWSAGPTPARAACSCAGRGHGDCLGPARHDARLSHGSARFGGRGVRADRHGGGASRRRHDQPARSAASASSVRSGPRSGSCASTAAALTLPRPPLAAGQQSSF